MTVNVNGSAIVPSTPTYRLLSSGAVIDSGSVTITDETDLSVTIQPTVAGGYTLEVTFGVGTEIIIRKVTILVVS